jgi:hypothetical protein
VHVDGANIESCPDVGGGNIATATDAVRRAVVDREPDSPHVLTSL